MRCSVLYRRWPVGGIGGEYRTTCAIEPKSPRIAVGQELVRITFDANGGEAFSYGERDALMRDFLPLFEGIEFPIAAIHESEKACVILTLEPEYADLSAGPHSNHAPLPTRQKTA